MSDYPGPLFYLAVQDRAHLGSARSEHLLDMGRIGGQLLAPLAHRAEALDDPLGKEALCLYAAGAGGPLAVLDLQVVVAEEAM